MKASKAYLDFVLDYFLVLTSLCSVFVSCVSALYSLHSGGLRHIFRFASINLVFTLTCTNMTTIPRMLLTGDYAMCQMFAVVDHYFWISQSCWVCSLAFESLQNMPVLSPNEDFKRRAMLHCVLSFILPLVLLGVTVAAHFSQAHWLGPLYGGRFCSLANVGLFIFASVLPTSLAIILSVFFLLIAIYRFQPAKNFQFFGDSLNAYTSEVERTRKWLISSLVFIFATGICWCIHLFYSILHFTLAFYFSIFLDQLKATLISLLLMYNVRSEKRLNQKILWEKVRTNMNTISLHSFHCTPVCNPTLRGFPQRPQNDFNSFYQTQPRSMYEFETDHLSIKPGGQVPFESSGLCSSRLGQVRGKVTLGNSHRNKINFEERSTSNLQQLKNTPSLQDTPESDAHAQTCFVNSTDDLIENSSSLNNLNRTSSTPRNFPDHVTFTPLTSEHVSSPVENNPSEIKVKVKSNYVDISLKQ